MVKLTCSLDGHIGKLRKAVAKAVTHFLETVDCDPCSDGQFFFWKVSPQFNLHDDQTSSGDDQLNQTRRSQLLVCLEVVCIGQTHNKSGPGCLSVDRFYCETTFLQPFLQLLLPVDCSSKLRFEKHQFIAKSIILCLAASVFLPDVLFRVRVVERDSGSGISTVSSICDGICSSIILLGTSLSSIIGRGSVCRGSVCRG